MGKRRKGEPAHAHSVQCNLRSMQVKYRVYYARMDGDEDEEGGGKGRGEQG